MSSVEAVKKKLQHDEEWLRHFEANVSRSKQLEESIHTIVDDFEKHMDQLECNVLPMHYANAKLQIQQQNIQRLLKTIDATVQFYGKSGELESAIRDGSPALDLESYMEQMEHLQQAVNFFQAHPNYGTQLENMKMTLESGFLLLEKEYRNVVAACSSPLDAQSLVDALDEQYELIANRSKELTTVKKCDKMARLGEWLQKRGRGRRFFSHYSTIRGEIMERTLRSVLALHSSHSLTSLPGRTGNTTRGPQAKSPFGGHKAPGAREAEGAETEGALLLLASLVALQRIEEEVLEKAVTDVTQRAQVHRELFTRPLSFALKTLSKTVMETEGSLPSLLPLLRFLAAHNNQLTTIASNSSLEPSYSGCVRSLTLKCSSFLNDYVERASGDGKFAPSDGNVHPVTASTLKTLYLLSHYRQVLTNHVLILSAAHNESPSLLMPKLFARMLSALGQMLNHKADSYDDPTLGAIFMLNNCNYIAKALEDEESGLLPVLKEQNANIRQYYLSAITKHITEYIASWRPVLQTMTAVDQIHPDDRNALRNMILAFNAEFEKTVAAQREYCVSDSSLAEEVRAKVKAAVVPVYWRLYGKAASLHGENSLSKHLRYTEESLDVNIDRLFDVAA